MKLKALVAGAILATVAGSAMAATDGSVGTAVPPANATSTGNLLVTLRIPNIVRISGLADIDLGTYAGAAVSGQDTLCVYRNATGLYSITADGTNTPGSFLLSDGGGNTIAYTVSWSDGGAPGGISAGVAANMANASTTSTTCGGVDNATVGVGVSAAAGDAAAATGTYTDTLVLTVTSR